MSQPGEFELIERYFGNRSRGRNVEIGIGDDAAVVSGTGRIAIAVDTLVEGVHFPADLPADAIGYRALAVNISDIAAMGLAPSWFTLALTLPGVDESWLAAFAAGLDGLAESYDLPLVGGDTTRGPLTITIQVIAEAGSGPVLTRSGANPGDAIYVSGTLGDAAAALAVSSGDVPDELVRRFRYPEPRVGVGTAMRELATAAIDISDGLLADLGHICAASSCGARIDVGSLPLSVPLLATVPTDKARSLALSGGDDYELCLAVPPGSESRIASVAAAATTQLTRIGECVAGTGIELVLDGRHYTHHGTGYRHF